jgi:hypothetical protein
MKRAALQGAALLMTMSAAAFAQTPDMTATPIATAPAPTASPAPAKTAPADAEQQNGPGLRSQLQESLEKAGFTNVAVMAGSFVVQATDKSGNPVTMFLNPNSMTVVTSEKDADAAAAPASGPAAKAPPASIFATIPARDDLTSKVVGLDVYNNANQNIGTIRDVAYTATGVQAYIIGVGGFLGMGDHYVAVRPSAMTLTYNAGDKTWHAAMDANADALKAAPEYKYPSAS